MTNKQLINQLCYEYSTKNYNEEKLRTTHEIKKKLNLLEEYKKIEEELGIDLITLFKALKNGFYHIDKNKHIYTTKPTKGNGGSMNFYTCLECIIAEDTFGDQYIFSLKDYGKTWALTKEELKNDK